MIFKHLKDVRDWSMWISRGKYSGQKGQKVQGPCGRSVSALFQKCQGDSGRHYKPWKWKILERCLNIVSPTNAIFFFKSCCCYYYYLFFLVSPFQEPQQDGEKGWNDVKSGPFLMVAGTRSGRSEEGNTESACPCSRLIAAVTALISEVWGSCLLPCSQHLLDRVGGDGEASLKLKATPVAPHLV